MFIGVHHVGLQGPDPAHALAAFTHFCAMAVVSEAGQAWARGPNLYLHAQAGAAPERIASVHATGLAHVCVQAQSPAGARRRLDAQGVQLIAEPTPLGTGFHYAYGRDRDGRLLELETAPHLAGEPPGWFGHVAFVTQDLARLSAFYAALTGRAVQPGQRIAGQPRVDRVAGLTGVDVEPAWIHGPGLTLEFWRYHAPCLVDPLERQCGYRHLAFEVDDAAAALRHARALGAGPGDEPGALFGAASSSVRDPDGNLLRFVAFGSAQQAWSLRALTTPNA